MKFMEIWDRHWPVIIAVAGGLVVGLFILPKFFR